LRDTKRIKPDRLLGRRYRRLRSLGSKFVHEVPTATAVAEAETAAAPAKPASERKKATKPRSRGGRTKSRTTVTKQA
jgi:hypothetical protein